VSSIQNAIHYINVQTVQGNTEIKELSGIINKEQSEGTITISTSIIVIVMKINYFTK